MKKHPVTKDTLRILRQSRPGLSGFSDRAIREQIEHAPISPDQAAAVTPGKSHVEFVSADEGYAPYVKYVRTLGADESVKHLDAMKVNDPLLRAYYLAAEYWCADEPMRMDVATPEFVAYSISAAEFQAFARLGFPSRVSDFIDALVAMRSCAIAEKVAA